LCLAAYLLALQVGVADDPRCAFAKLVRWEDASVEVIEPRREWWTQAAAWAAYILYQAGNDERWQEFYAAALAMVQKRPLHEISLMKWVAEQTAMASETRKMVA
jgi:hypothetical protein